MKSTKSERPKPRGRCPWRVALSAALLFISACSENSGEVALEDKTKTDRPTKGLGEGYRDGFNDGQASWTDIHANWTWLWLMSEDYRSEYDRGWADGRQIRKLKDQAQEEQSREP